MRAPTAREIQVFVAGALAMEGFYFISAAIRDSIPTTSLRAAFAAGVIADVIVGLALPLGIALLAKSTFALRVAYVYLGLVLFLACVGLAVSFTTRDTTLSHNAFFYRYLVAAVGRLVLLLLLLWSRSRQCEMKAPPNHALQPTAGRSDA